MDAKKLSSTHYPDGGTHPLTFRGSKKILHLVMRSWGQLRKNSKRTGDLREVVESQTRTAQSLRLRRFDGGHINLRSLAFTDGSEIPLGFTSEGRNSVEGEESLTWSLQQE
jgi:hypothetical protein